MTIKEAIEILRDQQLWKRVVDTLDPRYMNKLSGAICVAIDTMEKPRPDWTPCAEGLPKKDGAYDVTVKSAFGKLMLLPGYFRDGAWWNCPYSEHIIAWMPKPAPYNPDRKEDADHIIDTNKKVED